MKIGLLFGSFNPIHSGHLMILSDLSHLLKDLIHKTRFFEGLRSVWNRMLIIQTDMLIANINTPIH